MRREIDALIGELYRAAEPEIGWAEAGHRLAATFGATQASLQLCELSNPAGTQLLAAQGVTATEATLYLAHHHAFDPLTGFGRHERLDRSVLGGEMLEEQTLLRSEYWNDFAAPHGRGFHLMGAQLGMMGGKVALVGLLRAKEAENFTEDERQAMDEVLPHLKSAIRLWQRLSATNGVTEHVALMRDALGLCIVCDGGGRPLLVSPAAERQAPAIGLRLAGPRIGLSSPSGEAKLLALIARTAEGGPGGLLILARQTPLGRVLLRATRFLRSVPGVPVEAPPFPVLVEIRIVGAGARTAMDALRMAFGFSMSEAQIAVMASEGLTADQMATERGTSVATVRTQIRSVLGKTDTGSLRELSALLAALG